MSNVERFTINNGKKAHTPQKEGTKHDRVQALCGAYAFIDRDHMTHHPVTFENEGEVEECGTCNRLQHLTPAKKLRL